MIVWDRIDPSVVAKSLADALQACADSRVDWSSDVHSDTKSLLRKALFPAQTSRCAYCRRPIKDEVGHVEIDHILPKAASQYTEQAGSNNDDHRRSTNGYPEFRFEPLNLILTCKRCNNRKGTHDCRLDRTKDSPNEYPTDPADYIWIHPYFHSYNEHIEIYQGCIYLPYKESIEGKAVIKECDLASLQAIEMRAAELALNSTMELGDVLVSAWAKQELGPRQIAHILCVRFEQLDFELTLRELSFCERRWSGLQRAVSALTAML